MDYQYEHVEHPEHLPLHVFFHSVKDCTSHWHRELEFLFVLHGSILVLADGKNFFLKQNDVLLMNSGQIHLSHETGIQNLVLAMQIDPRSAERLCPEISESEFQLNEISMKNPGDSRLAVIRRIMAQSMWEARLKKSGYLIKLENNARDLLVYLLREFPRRTGRGMSSGYAESERTGDFMRLKRIIGFIERNFSEKITVSELAAMERISEGYISRFFRKNTGCSINEYIQIMRLRKSLHELTDSGYTISRIAFDHGFPSVKAYNLLFRKMYNMTPGEWRRNSLECRNMAVPQGSGYGNFDQNLAVNLLKPFLADGSEA